MAGFQSLFDKMHSLIATGQPAGTRSTMPVDMHPFLSGFSGLMQHTGAAPFEQPRNFGGFMSMMQQQQENPYGNIAGARLPASYANYFPNWGGSTPFANTHASEQFPWQLHGHWGGSIL